MKFKNLKHILIAVTVVALMTGTALASGFTRTIQANYVGVKLVINGVEVKPTDAAGNPVEPFISEGTTYLPVRAVAEALGEEVSWDGTTKTVSIGKAVSPETIPYQVNGGTLYDGTTLDSTFSVAGKKYNAGVVLRSIHGVWYGDVSGDFDGSTIWNTEGYQTMTFTVGHVGDKQRNGTLYVSLNGVAAGEYPLTWDGAPQTITVPLGSSANVKLTLVVPEVLGDRYNQIGWPQNATSLAESYGIYNVSLS